MKRLLLDSSLLAVRVAVDLLFKRDRSEVVVKFCLLLVADLLLELLLVDDSLLRLLEGLLDARLHPVGVVASGLNVEVVKLLLDVLPDLSILQEGVKLDDLHNLFLVRVELVEVETHAVEGAEDRRSQVVILDNLGKNVADVRFVVLVATFAHVAGSIESHAKDTRSLRP